MNITTEHVFPPIPIRDYDWKAMRKEDEGEEHATTGWGETEQAAISDLIDLLEEDGQ